MTTSRVPEKLYHAAPECVVESIFEHGIRSSGGVYAASSPAEALQFMWFRLLDHAHVERDEDGKPVVRIIEHEMVAVWEIDTAQTNRSKWSVGTDHSPTFFGGAESWVYHGGDIPAEAIECYSFTRETILEAVEDGRAK